MCITDTLIYKDVDLSILIRNKIIREWAMFHDKIQETLVCNLVLGTEEEGVLE